MVRCSGCARHVREVDVHCPFCSKPRSPAVHRALQLMGGVTTSVVLAACYGGFDDKSWSTGYVPTPGTPSGTPTTGTLTGGTTTSTFSVTTTWTDVDAGPPSDSDADGVNDTNCNADTLEIAIDDPLGVVNWEFGMTEQGASGWTGEDCLAGYAGFAFCHAITAPSTTLTEVCTPAEIVEGATTLFDASKDPFLTYYLADASACFVWGADVGYYAALGCTELL